MRYFSCSSKLRSLIQNTRRDLFEAKLAKVKSMDKWTQHSKHFDSAKKAELKALGGDYDKCVAALKQVCDLAVISP